MTLQPRPYRGLDDLQRMKALVVEARKASPHSGYPHIGDLDWWLFYGLAVKGEPSEEVVTLWEEDGELVGWVVLELPNASNMMVKPSLRGTACEEQIHAWTEERLASRLTGTDRSVIAYACADETARDA